MQESLKVAVRDLDEERRYQVELKKELAAVRAERDQLRETVDKQRSAPVGPVVLSGCTIGTLVLRREGVK